MTNASEESVEAELIALWQQFFAECDQRVERICALLKSKAELPENLARSLACTLNKLGRLGEDMLMEGLAQVFAQHASDYITKWMTFEEAKRYSDDDGVSIAAELKTMREMVVDDFRALRRCSCEGIHRCLTEMKTLMMLMQEKLRHDHGYDHASKVMQLFYYQLWATDSMR